MNVYNFKIEYFVFKEGDMYISYCPSLDLSTSGTSLKEAKSNFKEAFDLYVETCEEMGTLEADLEAHGWKKVNNSIKLPSFNVLMRKPEMKQLMNSNIAYSKIVSPARIPAFA